MLYCYVHSYNVNADFILTVTLSLSLNSTLANVTQTTYALIYFFAICIINVSFKVNILMINKRNCCIVCIFITVFFPVANTLK